MDAYVWQRSWTPEVSDAVEAHRDAFDRMLVLAAEWTPAPPTLVEPAFKAESLGQSPVVAVLRVGAPPSALDAETLPSLAERAVARLQAAGAHVVALQVDLDAPSSQLAAYAALIRATAARCPVPVEITALPDWLHRPELPELLDAADGWTLQLHRFSAPASPEALPPLLDPDEARAAIEAAAQLGRPFSIALPTCGYTVAFAPDGRYLGATAERSQPWSGAVRTATVRADAAEIAALLEELRAEHPPELTRIGWFRLPNEADILAWRWPTLEALLEGRRPEPALTVHAVSAPDGLVSLRIANEGDADGAPTDVRLCCAREPLALESLGGWTAALTADGLRWVAPEHSTIRPGESAEIGWFRLSSHQFIQASFIKD